MFPRQVELFGKTVQSEDVLPTVRGFGVVLSCAVQVWDGAFVVQGCLISLYEGALVIRNLKIPCNSDEDLDP